MTSEGAPGDTPLTIDELELFLELEQWEAKQSYPPSVFQVVETGNPRLIGAFILRGFRQAARKAVGDHRRVMELRELAYLAFEAADAAESFLRTPSGRLDDRTPLQAAMTDGAGRDQALRELSPQLRGAAMRVADRLFTAWGVSEADQRRLLELDENTSLNEWRANPALVTLEALARISVLLGIFRDINLLLPSPSAADGWVRRPNSAPLFRGRSALDLMLERGLAGMRDLRGYLDSQIWCR